MIPLPFYAYSHHCVPDSVCFCLLCRVKTDLSLHFQHSICQCFPNFLCSPGDPLHLLTVRDTSPGHICRKSGLTAHTSLNPPGPWLHLVSFGADNTNHQNTPVHKTRLQPAGYALVNLSITLKASGPCCCPDTNTQPTQPKS